MLRGAATLVTLGLFVACSSSTTHEGSGGSSTGGASTGGAPGGGGVAGGGGGQVGGGASGTGAVSGGGGSPGGGGSGAAPGGGGAGATGGTSSGGGTGGSDACVPWDQATFCLKKAVDCGTAVGNDNCGTPRSEPCGICSCPEVCESGKCAAKTGFLVGANCQCKANCNPLDDCQGGKCCVQNSFSCGNGDQNGPNSRCCSGNCQIGQCHS